MISHYQELKLIDIPNERSSHSTAIPRVGGTAVFAPFFLICLILAFMNARNNKWIIILSMAFLLFLIGFWDDIKGIKASLKFVLEFIIILTGSFALFKSSNVVLVLMLTIFVMWIMNSFNFMDGIDGFAALHAVPIYIGYFVVTHNIVFLIVPCALLAFLLFNFPPAKIFMGDAGSLPLGFLIGITPFVFIAQDLSWPNINNIIITICFIILCDITFFFDASLTLVRRAIKRKNIFRAHRDHIYQHAFDVGISSRIISIYNCILTIIASSCAVYGFVFAKTTITLLQNYLVVALIIVVLYSLLRVATAMARNKQKENVDA